MARPIHTHKRQNAMKHLRNTLCLILFFGIFAISCSTTASTGELQHTLISTEQRAEMAHEGTISLWFFGVHELGTKNGESSLVITPEGTTILIDAGYGRDHELLVQLIAETGITHLDYVIFSHFHSDHIGDLARLAEAYEIGMIFLIDFPEPEESGATLRSTILSTILEKNIPYRTLSRGDMYSFDSSTTLRCFNPEGPVVYDKSVVDDRTRSVFENNHSMVFTITYGEHSFLYAGDIYKEREAELIDLFGNQLNSVLLKVPHHGLGTSSSSLFLMQVSPEVQIVNSGEPTLSTLDSLRFRARTLTTVAYGTILVISDGKELRVIPAHEDITIGVYGE
ncbi:MAG TPA: MBL fold metallo-hydrolase [Sphaerochaeta sp.]|nr:MBL fold metallo-hydrolase [Sphaerochaeta sp.]